MNQINNYRLFALLIDLVIISVLYSIASNFLILNIELGVENISTTNVVYGYSFLFVFYLFYFLIFDFTNNGNTLGKILTKITVVSKQKNKLNYNKFLRTILKIISLVIFPVAAILFFTNGTSLQDKITKTKTIKSN
ncbi:hypothetical protein ULMA_31680 [Patiriisocius marinus]|uniref:RDD domain-containing protein n=1 Tax=Patiriisocius marinus TaxID=1397112 RepID=A0A5J4J587_9FLAO|nr:RDD family protein [Patiriisocius marinus]GER61060.1 hypothetical protein ULMA_31680 [Patiriisocius marinus]